MSGTAIVTGGCGFVGRHFVRALLERGYETTAVDNLSSGLHPDQWPASVRLDDEQRARFAFHHADMRDYVAEQDADVDLIIHLAAVVGGRLTIDGDPLRVATDLAIDADFFNWVVAGTRPRKVVYFSSSAAYPIEYQRREGAVPLTEDMIDFSAFRLGLPDMTYGWSKLTGEFLAQHAAATYGLDVVSYRPFSGYAEDQSLDYPFTSIVQRVVRREHPVVVWGSGDQLRDFIHIDDVVGATFATMDQFAPGTAINLGSGEGTSFRQLATRVCELAGHDAPIVNDATKPEGVFNRVCNNALMTKHYDLQVSLDDGITRTLEHQRAATS